MKIVFMSSFLGNPSGGAEISTELLAKELCDDHDVRILSTRRSNVDNTALIPSSNYIPKNVILVGNQIIDTFLSNSIEKILRKDPPDIIHIHDIYILPAGLRTALRLDIPTVVTVRDPIPKNVSHSRGFLIDNIHSHLLKARNDVWIKNLKNVDKIIAVSKFIKSSLENLQLQSDVIYNLPPSWNYLSRTKEDRNIILLSAGRLHEEKGIDVLLLAIDIIVKEKITNFKLIIAGDGPHKKKLKYMCKLLGIERYVEFVGKVSQEKLRELYFICDIVVFPSVYHEPLGRVAIEAGIMGRPIIASKIGGIPEIVDDRVTGLLVPPNDPYILSRSIIELIENEDIRKMMEKNGRATILKKINPRHIADQHIELYRDLV